MHWRLPTAEFQRLTVLLDPPANGGSSLGVGRDASWAADNQAAMPETLRGGWWRIVTADHPDQSNGKHIHSYSPDLVPQRAHHLAESSGMHFGARLRSHTLRPLSNLTAIRFGIEVAA